MPIELKEDGERVLIKELEILNPDLHQMLSRKSEECLDKQVKRCINIGISGLRTMSTKKEIEPIKKEFDRISEQLEEMLDPNKDTPTYQLKREILNKIDSLEKTVIGERGKEETRKKTTLKGFDFEEVVEDKLRTIAKNLNGAVEDVSEKLGEMGTESGDFILELTEINKKIVIEAKDESDLNLRGKTGVLSTLEEAIKNRDSDLGMCVSFQGVKVLPKEVGRISRYHKNKIVCGYGEEGETFEVALDLARILLKMEEAEEKGINTEKLEKLIDEIEDELIEFRNIKSKCTSIRKDSEAIKKIADRIKYKIKDRIKEAEIALETMD